MDLLGLGNLPFLPTITTRAPVPDDIYSVQTIDNGAEVGPEEVGLAPETAEEIWGAMLRFYRTGIHPAISACIRVRGQVILRRSIGYSHGGGPGDGPDAEKVMVTPETPFNIFSASKPMAAMVIHLLDQRHLLHLDDPVCAYIPEFALNGKHCVTIRHVLTHRAGIPVLPDAALDLSALEDIDNPEPMRLLCEATPTHRAGGRLAYHAVTGGFILGEIVRRVTGKNIRTVVDEEFCQPLGWRWMNYGVKRGDVDKVARSYFTGLPLVPPFGAIVRNILGLDFVEAVELSNDPRYLMGVLPAANLIATADELCQFYQLLLDGGTLRGKRIFDRRTVWRATSEQSYGELDFTLGVPLRYGMGFMLGGEWFSLYGFSSHHAFGHLGLTNIVAWADPQRHLSVAIMTSGKPVLFPEIHRGIAVVYSIASSCPKDENYSMPIPDDGALEGFVRPKRKRGSPERDNAERDNAERDNAKRGSADRDNAKRTGTKREKEKAQKKKRKRAAAAKSDAKKSARKKKRR